MTRTREPGVDQLVEQIVQATTAEAGTLERQEMRAQNRLADRRHKAIQELLSRGETGRAALEGLLHHELPLVRLAAATSVFEWASDRAVPVLE